MHRRAFALVAAVALPALACPALAGGATETLFGPPSPFSGLLSADGGAVVYSVDLDFDGVRDVVSASGEVIIAHGLGGIALYPGAALGVLNLGSEILEIDELGFSGIDARFIVRTADGLRLVSVASAGPGSYSISQVVLATGAFGYDYHDCVRIADIDGDGVRDVVSFRTDTAQVVVYHGTGPGQVNTSPTVSPSGPGMLVGLTLADLDGDGRDDFVGLSVPGGMYPLENLGGGMFASFQQPAPPQTYGADATGATAGDFTGDGNADVLVVGFSSQAHLWTGDGLGGFLALPTSYTTDSSSGYVVSADFNGDGITDAAIANFTTDSVGVLLGNGAGFDAPFDLPCGDGPVQLSALDIDGDGDTDLLVSHKGFVTPAGPMLLENSGGGENFVPESILSRRIFDSRAMAVGDLDGDGLRDILVTQLGSGMQFVHNMGDGMLSQVINLNLPVSYPEMRAVETGDADPRNLITYRNTSPSRVGWLRYNTGTQSLNFGGNFPLPTLPLDLTAADMNGDGIDDMLVSHAGGAPAVTIYLQTTTATFQPGIQVNGPGGGNILLTGDLDGVNGDDLVVAEHGIVRSALRTGPATFGEWVTRSLPELPTVNAGAVGELDGEPGLDLVFVGVGPMASGNRLIILPDYVNDGPPIVVTLPGTPLTVAALDIDGDGDSDLTMTLDRPGAPDALATLLSDNGAFDGDSITLHLAGASPNSLILADLHEPVQQRGETVRALPEAIVLNVGSQAQGNIGVTINLNMTEVREPAAAPCPGDTNGDNQVNFTDLNAVLSAFGQSGAPGFSDADLNNDGVVNFIDLNAVLSAFGASCA